jgi:probable F420-dependent oxidoreductase
MHPFRFGICGWAARDAEAWQTLARRAEALGYDAFVMPDHLGGQLSPIAALATAAAVTSRITIGAWVFANDFRHPLVLAREAATLDILSNGRLELGLGAGWRLSDYRSLGRSYDRAGLRIDRLEESIRIIKRLLRGERVDHAGTHYQLKGATVGRRPVQRPYPRLAIGGGGPRILRLAAREADIVGLLPKFNTRGRPTIGEATDAATEKKVALLREAAGERFERLELSVWVADADLIEVRRPLAAVSAATKSLAPWIVGGSPYVLYGTVSGLREQLLRRRERAAISYYMWPAGSMEAMAPLVAELSGR